LNKRNGKFAEKDCQPPHLSQIAFGMVDLQTCFTPKAIYPNQTLPIGKVSLKVVDKLA